MVGVEVPALDLPLQARFLAVLLRLVVLLSLLAQAVRGVVMRVGRAVHGKNRRILRRDTVLCGAFSVVAVLCEL